MADGELNVDGLISRLLEGKFAVLFEKEETYTFTVGQLRFAYIILLKVRLK